MAKKIRRSGTGKCEKKNRFTLTTRPILFWSQNAYWVVENKFNSCDSNCADRNFSSKNFCQKGPILSFKASNAFSVNLCKKFAKTISGTDQMLFRSDHSDHNCGHFELRWVETVKICIGQHFCIEKVDSNWQH